MKLSLIDLLDEAILGYLFTGFCEKFNSGMKIIYCDKNNEFKFINEIAPQTQRLWSEICKVYRNNPENTNYCCECDIENAKNMFASDNPQVNHYKCKPLGLIDIIAPIKINNNVIGVVITGQRILNNEADTIEQEIIKKYPDYKNEYEDAFQKERNNNISKICSLNDIESFKKEVLSFSDLIGSLSDKIDRNRLMVKKLEYEKNYRETYFERVSHSLSLPIEAILIKSSNLLEETSSDDKKYSDTKELFNDAQSLCLMVQNILYGSEAKTSQENPKFVKKDIIPILSKACKMFMVEAKEKCCDLKVLVKIDDKEFLLDINDLKNINMVYKKIFCEQLQTFPIEIKYFIVNRQNKSKKMEISDLVEYCYQANQNETYEVYDAEKKDKIKYDFN